MEEILVMVGVFALGYVLTMSLVFALLKLFFPIQSDPGNVEKKLLQRPNRSPVKVGSRLRKVRLANG